MAKYDDNLLVIGAGSGGLIAALIAATLRAKVTLIERHKMGGDCLNTGCVPSKTLLSAAKAAHVMRHGSAYGLKPVEPEVDFPAVMERVQAAIKTIEPKDSVERYTELGVHCIIGSAELVDAHHVKVNGQVRSARNIVIATGGQPFVPPLPGLETITPLTSDNVWELREQPERLVVVGGGPIGCELSQAFTRLGTQVTLLEMGPQIMGREDAEVAEHMQQVLTDEGVSIRTQTRAVSVAPGEITVEHDGGSETLPFDELLFAVGRRANTDGLNVEAAGVQLTERGTVEVDEYLRSSQPNIFACGDVAGPYQFTHMASHQAGYAALNALFGRFWKSKVDYRVVPWATYTEPEVARVGLSERDAADQGIAVEVTRYGLDDLDRAIAEGSADGWVKVLTKPGSDQILGATIVGPHAGEIVQEFVSAMTHNLGLKKIMGTIHIYPTVAEANKLAAGAWRRARAPEGALNFLGRVHNWLR